MFDFSYFKTAAEKLLMIPHEELLSFPQEEKGGNMNKGREGGAEEKFAC